jgi:hypothetical protein
MMSEPAPIACALTPAGLAGQARRWRDLIARSLLARTETGDGLRLSFPPAAEDELRALASVEAGCCAWATWRVERADGAVVLDARSAAEGVAVLRAMFPAS